MRFDKLVYRESAGTAPGSVLTVDFGGIGALVDRSGLEVDDDGFAVLEELGGSAGVDLFGRLEQAGGSENIDLFVERFVALLRPFKGDAGDRHDQRADDAKSGGDGEGS